MGRKQVQKRLEVIEKHIHLVEGCIEAVSGWEKDMDPRLHKGSIAIYTSHVKDLQKERDGYKKELGLK